jgi:hypothetical protein
MRVLLMNLPQRAIGRLHETGDHDILKQHVTPAADIQYVDKESWSSRIPARPPRNQRVGAPDSDLRKDDELFQSEQYQGNISIHSKKRP